MTDAASWDGVNTKMQDPDAEGALVDGQFFDSVQAKVVIALETAEVETFCTSSAGPYDACPWSNSAVDFDDTKATFTFTRDITAEPVLVDGNDYYIATIIDGGVTDGGIKEFSNYEMITLGENCSDLESSSESGAYNLFAAGAALMATLMLF